jgi:hypothetical protein
MTNRKLLLVVLALGMLLGPGRGSASLGISSDLGNSSDWLVGEKPLLLVPSTKQVSPLLVANSPFDMPKFEGPVQLQVECCKDMFSRAPVTPRGLAVWVWPISTCQVPGTTRSRLPNCPTVSGATVNVTSIAGGTAYLHAQADASATPGSYIATITADSSLGRSSREVFIDVLPSWPADGPLPRCESSTPVISLGSIAPTPVAWKLSNLAKTSYSLAVGFSGVAASAGVLFTVVDMGPTTGPNPRDVAIVDFTNTKGRPVALRTTNSRDCSTPGQSITVAEGETKSIAIGATDTTTLVFSKSTCRAYHDWFDCWWRSALGMDDVFVLTEGPFWTLFGGRRVAIETIGDWGAMPRPDSVATIETQ